MRLPNGEDKIQPCTNYVKNGKSWWFEFMAIRVTTVQMRSFKAAVQGMVFK